MNKETRLRILFAEDNMEDLELAERELRQNGIDYESKNVITPEKFIEALHNFKPDIIISDLKMPNFDGIQTLQYTLLYDSTIPFIMLTGSTNEETAVACMKAGATDYIIKDRLSMLPFAVKEALIRKESQIETQFLEEKLLEEQSKFKTLYQTIDIGIVYQNAKGEIIDANAAAERMLGISIEQMRGLKSRDPRWKAIHEDGSDFPGDSHPAMVALRTKKKVSNVVMGVYNPKKEKHVWLNITALPQIDEKSGLAYQVYTVFDDISEKKEIIDSLFISEEKYRTLFHQMPEAAALHEIILNDKGIPCDYRFISVNPAFEEITGLKAEDIIGKTVLEVLPTVESFWIETYGNVALTGNQVQFENYNVSTGKHFSVSAYSPKKGEFVSIFYDITESVAIKEEINRKNEELSRHIKEKDKFFSIIAHDLKSPFNGLLGLSDMLAEDFDRFTKEDIQRMAKSMKSSANHLFKLLENLLEWSRLQRGTINFKPVIVDSNQILEQNLSLNKSLLDQKGIIIKNNVPDKTMVFCDVNMLQMIFRNILSNAIKFSNKGGSVEIKTNTISDKWQHFIIKDYGNGIDENEIENLFKLDKVTSNIGTLGETGTGLGLILCREYIEKNNGKIWIESKKGEWTIVNFTLPLK